MAKLTNPHQDRVEVAKSLFGILPKDADLNEAKEEDVYKRQLLYMGKVIEQIQKSQK